MTRLALFYGFAMGGDPHDFEPDYDCNTPAEIKAWEDAKAACECGREGLSTPTKAVAKRTTNLKL